MLTVFYWSAAGVMAAAGIFITAVMNVAHATVAEHCWLKSMATCHSFNATGATEKGVTSTTAVMCVTPARVRERSLRQDL